MHTSKKHTWCVVALVGIEVLSAHSIDTLTACELLTIATRATLRFTRRVYTLIKPRNARKVNTFRHEKYPTEEP